MYFRFFRRSPNPGIQGWIMAIVKWLLIIIVLGAAAGVLAGRLGLLKGKPPSDLGVHQGRLKPPSRTPNSVSSQADLYPDHPQRAYASIAPLQLKGNAAATLDHFEAIIRGMDGGEVVKKDPDYIDARFTTPLMKYVDDAEFWFDPVEGVIQVRSASRLGSGDFGVNRKRIEFIRKKLGSS
jgi:uncharacterized protein (DUF1499 family)